MRCSAVIVAAGRGSRFGAPLNKVLLPLRGSTVLEHAIAPFLRSPDVGEIILVANRDDRALLETKAAGWAGGRRIKVVEGGARRIDSSAAGVRATDPSAETVAIHDAARPIHTSESLARAIEAAERTGGAVVALPATDTMKRSQDGRLVAGTLARGELYHAQTPQVFRRAPFLAALESALAAGNDFTDDAAVAERAGIPVEIVAGSADNIKITNPPDLARAEGILDRRLGPGDTGLRIGSGFDIHPLVAGRRCVLGGVEIPSETGPLGHSDGDALLHALADAVLGAAGLDDLGTLFPDRDPQYKNADSRELFKLCVARAREAGFSVVNADCILILERPKIAPHRAAIRASLAGLLQISPERVNVKGKTAEGIGDIGSGRAVVAQCSVLLQFSRP
jgi:2-C-methyl-D-erythritol 4-phosphate cytidylyltransferase/2-C-methyl-D-erythritol 2,4-cyclodiphosphate synthase